MADAPAKEKKAEADATTEQPPKKKGKLLIIVALVVVLAGGGAAWFFLAKGNGDKEAAVAHEAKAAPIKPPVFVPIDPFTVNLTPGNGEQYLQVSATLRVLDEHAGEAVKQYMPEVRHRMLLLLSSKKAAEILTMDGRERLAEELRMTTNNILLVAAGKEPKPLVDKDGNKGKGESKAPAPAGENPEAKPADGEPPKDEATPEGEPAASSAKAATDDPVQSVLFTSFIIQ